MSYSKDWRLKIEINRVHDDEDLLVLVSQTGFLAKSSFAEILKQNKGQNKVNKLGRFVFLSAKHFINKIY